MVLVRPDQCEFCQRGLRFDQYLIDFVNTDVAGIFTFTTAEDISEFFKDFATCTTNGFH